MEGADLLRSVEVVRCALAPNLCILTAALP